MTRKTRIEIAVLAALALTAGFTWYSSRQSPSGSAHASSLIANYKSMGVENPEIHWDRLEEAQQTNYEAIGRDIFTGGSPHIEALPVTIPQPVDVAEQSAPPPPPPPQLALKYFGYGPPDSDSGSRAFLTDGAAVFIAAVGDTLLGHYHVVRISRASLEFEDMSTGRRGVSTIEDPGPAF